MWYQKCSTVTRRKALWHISRNDDFRKEIREQCLANRSVKTLASLFYIIFILGLNIPMSMPVSHYSADSKNHIRSNRPTVSAGLRQASLLASVQYALNVFFFYVYLMKSILCNSILKINSKLKINH